MIYYDVTVTQMLLSFILQGSVWHVGVLNVTHYEYLNPYRDAAHYYDNYRHLFFTSMAYNGDDGDGDEHGHVDY